MSIDKSKHLPPAFTTSQASLPGQIVVQPLIWMRCFPSKTLPFAILFVLAVVFAVAFMVLTRSAVGSGPLLALAIYAARRWDAQYQQIRRQVANGCLNPARVISMNPCLIAVHTDLASRPGQDWPVIKIVSQPLGRAGGMSLNVGDRLATVSLYSGSRNKPHWDDFYPVAVACVTGNAGDLRQAIERLDADPDRPWEALDASLAQVPTPTRPGLYWISAPAPVRRPLLSQ